MTKRSRQVTLALVVLVLVAAGGGAAALWWPQPADQFVRGPGPYERELSICQRGNFDSENRARVPIEFVANTVWHKMDPGDRLSIGGQAIMADANTGRPQRLSYECTSVRGDLVTSSVRPVSSAGTNLNDRNLR